MIHNFRSPNGYPSRRIVVYTNGIYYVWTEDELRCRAAFVLGSRWWAVVRVWLLLLPQLFKMSVNTTKH